MSSGVASEVGNATGFPGKIPRFQNCKTSFVRTHKTGFHRFNFGCQNCTEKRAEMYFIGILEAKLIALMHLQPKF